MIHYVEMSELVIIKYLVAYFVSMTEYVFLLCKILVLLIHCAYIVRYKYKNCFDYPYTSKLLHFYVV